MQIGSSIVCSLQFPTISSNLPHKSSAVHIDLPLPLFSVRLDFAITFGVSSVVHVSKDDRFKYNFASIYFIYFNVALMITALSNLKNSSLTRTITTKKTFIFSIFFYIHITLELKTNYCPNDLPLFMNRLVISEILLRVKLK